MADPTLYTVSYSFSDFQSNSPTTPLPAPRVDIELANIATAVASLVAAAKDLRNADGTLKNNVVTFNSLALGLQLTFDPTNGALVAAAVLGAQASAAAALASQNAAGTSATNSAASAAAAAVSAGSVNLALFLAKANNLAGLGSLVTSRANLGLGSVATFDVGGSATNIVQLDAGAKIPAYDGSQLINVDVLPVGAVVYAFGTTALAGTLKLNGPLLSRASFPRLWAYAQGCGDITNEANWSTLTPSFSTGDLATTFRIPDVRGEFFRAWDDGRGVDSGRSMGTVQLDALKDHTHPFSVPGALFAGSASIGSGGSFFPPQTFNGNTGSASIGAAETRPRNIPILPCIKY